MAEYSNEHKLLEAARKVRESGYTATDAFTPFPVHGIDEAELRADGAAAVAG